MRAFGPELRAAAFARWEREFPFLRAHAFRSAITDSGIAPHHAGHTTAWRLAVEDLLARGLIRVVCATTTLAAGLDVPARTVALSTLVRNSPDGPVVLSATEFHQMSGRAGRRGKDTIGVVVLPATSRDEAREGLALIDAEPDPVTSSFSPGYVQVLNLLRRSSLAEALGGPAAPGLSRRKQPADPRGSVGLRTASSPDACAGGDRAAQLDRRLHGGLGRHRRCAGHRARTIPRRSRRTRRAGEAGP